MNSILFHISPSDLASLGTLFIGLMLALLLLFAKRANHAANLYLSLALVASVLKTGGLTPFLLTVLGTLLHGYVRQLTIPNQRFRPNDLLHFCPLFAAYYMPSWLIMIAVIIYLYLSHRLIQNFYSRLRPVLMDRPRFAFRRLERLLFLLSALCAFSIFYDICYLAIAIVLIGMSVETILKPDIDPQLTTPITGRYDLKEKGRRLRESVAANRLYEDAELTLTSLAVRLLMHPHELSRIINSGLDKNFSDFINEFRVREVARKMQDPAYDRFTLTGIAYASGFNSERTFQRVFKELTGKTPLAYKKNLEKLPPIHIMAGLSRLQPVILRPESPPIWAHGKSKRNFMLKNYFKIAWRNLVKDKQFTLLNLFGLATGLACVLLIALWVSDEWQVDHFSANDSRLYQVLKRVPDGTGSATVNEQTQGLLYQSLTQSFPEIEVAACLRKERNPGIISIKERQLKAIPLFASNAFFQVLTYPLLSGNTANALTVVSGVMLSDRLALKLFQTTAVTGKIIRWQFKDNVDFSGEYLVKGVFQTPPAGASDQFDLVFPFELYAQKMHGTPGDVSAWGSNMVQTDVVLKPGTDVEAFNRKIRKFTQSKLSGDASYEGELFLQRYSDRYLHNNYVNGVPNGGRIEYVRLFSTIALLIIVIACINFMNLATAKAARRMKEVGIQKVMGASRLSLILQYLSGSLLMTFAAFILAIGIAVLLLPAFREITGKELHFHFSLGFTAAILGLLVLVGLFAGSYPALYLSGFNPIGVLKSQLNISGAQAFVRRGLVIFQFSVSVILIICVLVVRQQMDLVRSINLGYDKNNIIRFGGEDDPHAQAALIAEIKNIPGVQHATSMEGDLLGSSSHSGGGISWPGKDPNLKLDYYGNSVGDDFAATMGLKLAAGRSFSREFNDSTSVLFNETAISAMGIKDPVGKMVSLWGKHMQIIGVVKDYHFESLYKKIGPAFFTFSPDNKTMLVRIDPLRQQAALVAVQNLYHRYHPGLDFAYTYLDDSYNRLYASEQRVAILTRYFAGMAILISCLGLFGLAAFTAQKRQKEIGIRKVIGASALQVVAMLSKDFLRLVCLALIIALPVSWWACHHWLQRFAYRIVMSPLIFVLTALVVVAITLLTISFQSLKAALTNPVKSLRTE